MPIPTPSDPVTAGLTFLVQITDFLTDPTKFASWSLDHKLEFIRKGLDHALVNRDFVAADKFMSMYRVLDAQTGIG